VDSPHLGTVCCEFVFMQRVFMSLFIWRVNVRKLRLLHIYFRAINKIQTAYFIKYPLTFQLFSSVGIMRLKFIAMFRRLKIQTCWDVLPCRLQIYRHFDGLIAFFFRFKQFFSRKFESPATPLEKTQIACSVSNSSCCESL
jgi:hypothetical protein